MLHHASNLSMMDSGNRDRFYDIMHVFEGPLKPVEYFQWSYMVYLFVTTHGLSMQLDFLWSRRDKRDLAKKVSSKKEKDPVLLIFC